MFLTEGYFGRMGRQRGGEGGEQRRISRYDDSTDKYDDSVSVPLSEECGEE